MTRTTFGARVGAFTLALSTLVALSACDDGGTTPPDGSTDGATPTGCVGAADGSACGSGLICIAGACGASECGDGFVDTAAGEECEDGNETAFDGCEPADCSFTCEADTECDDGRECNGAETCSADHVCAAGTAPAPGAECALEGGGVGACRGADCVNAGCGNGVPDGGEDCDDGNDVAGDGCENDCVFSCTEDSNCADGDTCNGNETCDLGTHACVAGTDGLDCVDGNDCTMDLCHPVDGCSNPLVDADGDGHAPTTIGACGDDCDDDDATTFAGAPELCEAPGITPVDNDCDPATPNPSASLWFLDCDEDGFSIVGAPSQMSCAAPAPQGGCGWTTRVPVSGDTTSVDCKDSNGDVFPGQTAYFTTPIAGNPSATAYDYDCNGSHTIRYFCAPSSGACEAPSCSGGYLASSASNPNGCEFECGGIFCFYAAPTCGQSASYQLCGSTGTLCLSTRPSSRTQACH